MAEGSPRQIGRYKILGEIGRGAFGRVYRGLDPTVGRPVAIKILTDASEDIVTRFQNEATVAGNLRHKNIVTIYEYGDYNGMPFLAMEYLEGETVQQLITSRKPLSILDKCNIMAQVADGLYHAHRSGIIHRDVKPANIMVLPDHTAKIMDFGIARVIRDEEATRLTQEGSVVGTISYMSPEQFSGTIQVDALCDIFAFGVIWYELLAGRHPFQGPDAGAIMYKVMFEEPPPLKEVVSDFPQALQPIIDRTLAKDRDLRYPDLKELQLDLDPIRIELQRERGSALLVQAQELYEKGQLEPAQTVVLEVLTLDPSQSVARSLYDTVQRKLRQRTLQPKIEAHLKAGEEQLSRRRFGDSVKSFEAALRLDEGNAYILERCEHAREMLERNKEAASLLAEARRQFAGQNLTAAYRCASEALLHDPDIPDAADLVQRVQEAIARRQREQLIETALTKAGELKLLHAYDQALQLLIDLGPAAEDGRVELLLASIRSEKLEHDREIVFRNKMTAATDLLQARDFEAAVEALKSLQQDFSERREVDSLLSYARQELETELRRKAFEQTSARAAVLIEEHRYDEALEAIHAALQQYPGDGSLVRLLRTTVAAKADWELEQAVQKVNRQCNELRSQQRFAEAIEALEAVRANYPAEPRIQTLAADLQQAWDRHKREEAVDSTAAQARSFLSNREPGRAVSVLDSMLARYPDEPVLRELLDRAREQVRAQEKTRALDAISRQVGSYLRANDFERALEAVQRGLVTWPDEPVLLEQLQEIHRQRQAWERRQAITGILTRAREIQAARNFTAALDIINSARREYGDEPDLVQFAEQLQKGWDDFKRSEAIRNVAIEARALISAERPDEALHRLEQAMLDYPGEHDLETAAAEAKAAIAARERALHIQQSIEECNRNVRALDFDKADSVIQQALSEYPDSRELRETQHKASAARIAWERDQRAAEAIRNAKHLAAANQFDQALAVLTPALRESSSHPALQEAKRELDASFAEYKRRLAIAKTIESATAQLDAGRLEEALENLRAASALYGVADFRSLLDRGERELENRRREEAKARFIAAVEGEASELALRNQFEQALGKVADGLRRHPDDRTLSTLEKAIQLAWEKHKRALAIEEAANRAAHLIREEQLEEAFRLLGELQQQYPDEPRFSTLVRQCQRATAERNQRNEAIRSSEALIADKRFDEAVAVLQNILTAQPGHQRLTSLLAHATRQRDQARARAEAIRQELEAILAMANRGRFVDALRIAQSALTRHGDDASLARLRDEMQVKVNVQQAKLLMDQSQPGEALRLLEQTASKFGAIPEVSEATARAREQQAALARLAAIAAEVKKAREACDRQEFEAALAMVEDALRIWPNTKDLLELRESVLAKKTRRERELALQEAISLCETLTRENRLDTALQFVETLLAQFENEPALVQLKAKLAGEIRIREQQRQRKRALQEIGNLRGEAERATSMSELNDISASLTKIQNEYPQDQELSSAVQAVRAYLEPIEAAGGNLNQGKLDEVVRIADQQLSKPPAHPLFSTLKTEAQGRIRLLYLQDLQRRIGAEPDLDQRVRLLEEALARYPDEHQVSEDLRLTRNKLALVNGILQRAKAAEAAGDYDLALEQWNRVAAIHEYQPNVRQELERVQRLREDARRQAIHRWVESIEGLLRAGDLSKAEAALKQAQTEVPGAAEFRALDDRLKSRQQSLARARDLYAQARKTLASDWMKAEQLVNEAIALGSGLSPPDDLTKSIDRNKREANIAALLKKADQVRKTDPHSALETVDSGLASYPEESRLKTLRESLAGEVTAKRDSLLTELERIRKAGESESGLPQLESLVQRATAIQTENARDPAITSAAGTTIHGLQAKIRDLKRAALRHTLSRYSRVAAGVLGGALLVGAAWVAANWALRGTREVPVRFATAVSGVSLEAGGKRCVTPDCAFSLRPGHYTLTATKPGYKTVTQTVAVGSDQSQIDLPLSLEALPNVLQVNTNFTSGRIYIDRDPPRTLVNGAFTLSGLSDGIHRIRVSDGSSEFQAQWRLAKGRRPELAHPIAAKDVTATLIENIGSEGAIACNCGSIPVSVDGSAAGHTSIEPSELAHLSEGARQIGVGNQSFVLDVKPNPTLTVFLARDTDVGTLVVDAGADNAKVYVNNRMRGQTSGRELLRIPVSVGRYTVRVEKDGYAAAAPQTVDVAKGEDQPLTFALTPAPASLEIVGALPDAHVALDGKVQKDTNASGLFRAQGLTATRHMIELSKDGYTPARLEVDLPPGQTTRIRGTQLTMTKISAPPRVDGAALDAQDWSRVRNSTNPDELDTFVKNHPASAHVDEARNRSSQLRQEEAQANAAREATARAESAWESLDKSKKGALEGYLTRFPTSAHAAEAKGQIARLDKEEAARAEHARAQLEQEQREAAANKDADLQQQAIARTLANYESAYNALNLTALRSIWTDMPEGTAQKIGQEFQMSKSVTLQLQQAGPATIQGNSATVICSRKLTITLKAERRPMSHTEQVKVALSRTGSGWAIHSISNF